MKKWLIVVFLFQIFMINAFAQQSQTQHYVKVKSENLRLAPNGDIIAIVIGGTRLNVLKEEGQWVKVQMEGYIWKPSITSDLSAVEGYKIHAFHILLKTQVEAQSVLDKVKAGGDFKKLAAEYSIDPGAAKSQGDLGYFSRGDLIKEFEDVAFNLKINETSGIVKSSLGYHIIRRIE